MLVLMLMFVIMDGSVGYVGVTLFKLFRVCFATLDHKGPPVGGVTLGKR